MDGIMDRPQDRHSLAREHAREKLHNNRLQAGLHPVFIPAIEPGDFRSFQEYCALAMQYDTVADYENIVVLMQTYQPATENEQTIKDAYVGKILMRMAHCLHETGSVDETRETVQQIISQEKWSRYHDDANSLLHSLEPQPIDDVRGGSTVGSAGSRAPI